MPKVRTHQLRAIAILVDTMLTCCRLRERYAAAVTPDPGESTLHQSLSGKRKPQKTDQRQGGKNRRRGKNDGDDDKRELVFKEDGQGALTREGLFGTHTETSFSLTS